MGTSSMCSIRITFAWLFSTVMVGLPAVGEEAPGGVAFFESKIRPVLIEHCYECHSAESGNSEGGLALDTRSSMRRGGERGPTVVPDDVDKSLIIAAISHTQTDLEMPPAKPRLSASVLADFRKWVEMGAPDPRESDPTRPPRSTGKNRGEDHWAYQAVTDAPPPDVRDQGWARRELDRFVLAELERTELKPSPDANPRTFIRRLHFDLVGLPPHPDRIATFLAKIQRDGLDLALEEEVDLLLGSARYGERWGRHWMDVARFAESSGLETNVTFPHAWRYRNYVIDSFNDDKAYDRFLVEQIAGDLLPHDNDRQREERLIATGFLALGPKGLNEMNRIQFLADIIDEQINVVTKSVMASTVACARCHDHKFDPFAMKDYYSLAGIFASTKTFFGTSVAPGNKNGGDMLVLPRTADQCIPNRSFTAKHNKRLREELAALREESEQRRRGAAEALAKGNDPAEFLSLKDALRILWRSGGLEGQLKTVDEQGRALPLAMGVADRPQPTDAPLLDRGEISRPGETVTRGFPTFPSITKSHDVDRSQSGRLQLANWLTDPEHPLTARVLVNRVWCHLFDDGIVRSTDNFGTEGEIPSHPELLDHLAKRFVDGGWSIKSLIREIVLSRTYRQSSQFDQQAFLRDPENRLHWRHTSRRLRAESMRDAMLFLSGDLDLRRPRSSLIATIGDKPASLLALDKRVPADLDGSQHRSVYLPVIRDRLPDVLELFDFAEPSLVTGKRQTTNVPLQALYLMNSSFVRGQAALLARRAERDHPETDSQLRYLLEACYGRTPSANELRLGRDFVRSDSLANYCHALLMTAEFRHVD